MTDTAFHAELISIFTILRDLHTQYHLPDPYRGRVAALGFLVERYYPTQRAAPRYVISKPHPSSPTELPGRRRAGVVERGPDPAGDRAERRTGLGQQPRRARRARASRASRCGR